MCKKQERHEKAITEYDEEEVDLGEASEQGETSEVGRRAVIEEGTTQACGANNASH